MKTDYSYKIDEFFYDRTFDDYPNLFLKLFTFDVVNHPNTVRATFTREHADDLRNIHGIDAEAELTAILSQEINRAIVNELLDLGRID